MIYRIALALLVTCAAACDAGGVLVVIDGGAGGTRGSGGAGGQGGGPTITFCAAGGHGGANCKGDG